MHGPQGPVSPISQKLSCSKFKGNTDLVLLPSQEAPLTNNGTTNQIQERNEGHKNGPDSEYACMSRINMGNMSKREEKKKQLISTNLKWLSTKNM